MSGFDLSSFRSVTMSPVSVSCAYISPAPGKLIKPPCGTCYRVDPALKPHID